MGLFPQCVQVKYRTQNTMEPVQKIAGKRPESLIKSVGVASDKPTSEYGPDRYFNGYTVDLNLWVIGTY